MSSDKAKISEKQSGTRKNFSDELAKMAYAKGVLAVSSHKVWVPGQKSPPGGGGTARGEEDRGQLMRMPGEAVGKIRGRPRRWARGLSYIRGCCRS